MRIAVPYYEQKESHTCGPAVLRMIAAFYGQKLQAKDIKNIAKTEEEGFTRNSDLVEAAEKLGFKTEVKEHAAIDQIAEYLGKNIPVIVNFIEPGEEAGHFAIVIGIEDGNIIFNDPTHGPDFPMSIDEFEKRWQSGFENYQRWMMVVTE